VFGLGWVYGGSVFEESCWLLAIGCWLFGCWLLAFGFWLLAGGYRFPIYCGIFQRNFFSLKIDNLSSIIQMTN
jgi:hypothetical protein